MVNLFEFVICFAVAVCNLVHHVETISSLTAKDI